jgi:nicotinamidase/pyrazinamidase
MRTFVDEKAWTLSRLRNGPEIRLVAFSKGGIVMTDLTRRQMVCGLAAFGTALVPLRGVMAASKIPINDKSVLIVVDMQNCFLPGGSLAVKDGEQVIPIINSLAKSFANVVLTQDWHTPGHISFASVHEGKKPFEMIKLPYGEQVLWPDHCVQGTQGAAISADISIPQAALVVRKGFHKDIDSYSAFYEADHKTPTGLAGYLKQRGLNTVFVTGLATDFCVGWTAIDARRSGFATYVIEDACRGIDVQGSLAKAWTAMAQVGVNRIKSSDIAV